MVSIEFDPKKDAANLKKHGVSLSEGDGVLNDPLALTVEDRSAEGEQRVRPTRKSEGIMRKVYDFSKGKRGAVLPAAGKTRITIYLDNAVLKRFKAKSQSTGKGYQTLINEVLKSYVGLGGEPITRELVRKIVREELAAHG
jgi:uncharacterized protein (DUF4415 family)